MRWCEVVWRGVLKSDVVWCGVVRCAGVALRNTTLSLGDEKGKSEVASSGVALTPRMGKDELICIWGNFAKCQASCAANTPDEAKKLFNLLDPTALTCFASNSTAASISVANVNHLGPTTVVYIYIFIFSNLIFSNEACAG